MHRHSRTPRLAALLLVGSALLAASPALADTLREALAAAYTGNPTLEAARAQLRATDETVYIQQANGLPSLTTSATYTEYLKQSSSSFISPQRQVSGNLDLTVPLYNGGAVVNNVAAAETRVQAGRASLRGTESGLFSQVTAAYMDVIQNEAIVGLTRNNLSVLDVNLQATSDRFEIGDLTRTDVAQSASRRAIALSDVQTAEANLTRSRENYIQLVGLAPDNLQPPPPLPGLPANVEQAVDVALENNPDLIAAKERAVAAGFDVNVAGAARLPRVEGFAGSGYQNYLGTLGSIPGTGTANQSSSSAQAGVRFSVPIFNGGRVSASQRQAQATESAALEQVIGAERQVIAQVRGAYASWQAARAIIASTQSAVDAAELSLEGVRAENTVGNRTILDILDAQQELLRVQVQLVTARRNEYVAGFTLLAAMGRAEARDLGLEGEVPLYDPAINFERDRPIFFDWNGDAEPMAQATRTVDIPAQDGEISTAP
jgi:outer membrane protein